MPLTAVDLEEVRAAAERIAPFIHRTPVLRSRTLDRMVGAELHLKCENFQKIGAFKIRGATNAVMSLPVAEAARGVATHSSGNHAAAVARAARERGIPAWVVMPETTPRVKREAVAGYGAEIVYCEPTQEARETAFAALQRRTGATLIHPFDDDRVIAGQGTCALELCEQVDGLDVVVAPIGGGGLMSGTAIVVRALRPSARLVGVEPALADDARRSLESGRIVPSGYPETVADGLRTSLCERTFAVLREHVSAVWTAGEDEILAALRLVLERMKIVIEPSSAAVVAALLEHRADLAGARVGVVLSGGNVELAALPWPRP